MDHCKAFLETGDLTGEQSLQVHGEPEGEQ
jgi:hypothetical protein